MIIMKGVDSKLSLKHSICSEITVCKWNNSDFESETSENNRKTGSEILQIFTLIHEDRRA